MNPFASRRGAAILALLCTAILFVGVNIIAGRLLANARIDLTQEHLYTLSDGSLRTLAEIGEPITLRFYYTKDLGEQIPSYGLYAQHVREMLEEYAALAHGRLRLEIIDPQPYSAAEDRAVAFGLQGVPIDQSGEQVYFGLAATNSTDDQQVIPFFQPDRERFLEYDLTKLVHALARPKPTVIGLISDLPLEGDMMAAMQGRPTRAFAILDQLRSLFEIRTIGTDLDKIEPGIDVLWIVHPQHLSDKTQYAIDQFVLRGGKVLVFVDPNSEIEQAQPNQYGQPPQDTASDLPRLFKAWGFEMRPKTVVGDRQAARKVNAGGYDRPEPIDYVAWLALKKANLNPDDVVTADLSQINMATAGIVQPLPGAKTIFEPLILTSRDAETIPEDKFQGPVPDVAGLLNDFKPANTRFVLAARITGPAQTAFPGGPPKPPPPAKGAAAPAAPAAPAVPQLMAAKQPINVIAVADTDMLADRWWVQSSDFFGRQVAVPTANNADFVANALEVLAGGNDLVSLRSRGTSARPFEVVQDIQRAADARYSGKEHELQDKLKATESKIKDLREDKSGNVVLTAEQTTALDSFRKQMLQTRRQLREVQLALNQDINRLKARLVFVDVALIPILVGLIAILLGIVRLRRRKRRSAAG